MVTLLGPLTPPSARGKPGPTSCSTKPHPASGVSLPGTQALLTHGGAAHHTLVPVVSPPPTPLSQACLELIPGSGASHSTPTSTCLHPQVVLFLLFQCLEGTRHQAQ